jgi:hypothetical protein
MLPPETLCKVLVGRRYFRDLVVDGRIMLYSKPSNPGLFGWEWIRIK